MVKQTHKADVSLTKQKQYSETTTEEYLVYLVCVYTGVYTPVYIYTGVYIQYRHTHLAGPCPLV